jgi:hypothetical protein
LKSPGRQSFDIAFMLSIYSCAYTMEILVSIPDFLQLQYTNLCGLKRPSLNFKSRNIGSRTEANLEGQKWCVSPLICKKFEIDSEIWKPSLKLTFKFLVCSAGRPRFTQDLPLINKAAVD